MWGSIKHSIWNNDFESVKKPFTNSIVSLRISEIKASTMVDSLRISVVGRKKRGPEILLITKVVQPQGLYHYL